LTLGSFHARRGETAEAEAEYKAALRIAPQFAPAAVNLADLYRQTARCRWGSRVARGDRRFAKGRRPPLRAGLALIRLKRSGDALTELQKAAELGSGLITSS
jgi:Flp pilus assembly protein TadD